MSTCDSVGVCPKCKYEHAWHQVDCRSGLESGACPRCGCGYDGWWDDKGKWVEEEYGGLGVVSYRVKGEIGLGWRTYSDADELAEHREALAKVDCETAFYTYQQDGVWYIQNLLTGEQVIATEESLEEIRRPVTCDQEEELPVEAMEPTLAATGEVGVCQADEEFLRGLEAL